jgi:hypothetical protein
MYLEANSETRKHFNRVVELIAGFETPYGMELLSTVHWIANREGAKNAKEAKKLVDQWSDRKKALFPERHVDLAWNVLQKNHLIPS